MTDEEIITYTENDLSMGEDHFDIMKFKDFIDIAEEARRVLSIWMGHKIEEESAWDDFLSAIVYAGWCSAIDNIAKFSGSKWSNVAPAAFHDGDQPKLKKALREAFKLTD